MTDGRAVRLSTAVITKDEQACIVRSVRSALSISDEVVVNDTGSADATMARARDAGAVVVRGSWHHDFARARNDALAHVTGDWVLSLDADEEVTSDGGLRAWVAEADARGVTVAEVLVQGRSAAGAYAFRAPRLFRRVGARWRNPVHEVVVPAPGGSREELPGGLLTVHHNGYEDPVVTAAKSQRNYQLARTHVGGLIDRSVAGPVLAEAVLHLGRSAVGCHRAQDAVDAFEAVRELVPHGPLRIQATDYLVRLLIAAGENGVARVLIADLQQERGSRDDYCRWLEAQIAAQTGDPASALQLLGGVMAIVDPSGEDFGAGQVWELRALCHALLGQREAAVDALSTAMIGHGRSTADVGTLVEWWGPRDRGALLDRVGGHAGPWRQQVLTALAGHVA